MRDRKRKVKEKVGETREKKVSKIAKDKMQQILSYHLKQHQIMHIYLNIEIYSVFWEWG